MDYLPFLVIDHINNDGAAERREKDAKGWTMYWDLKKRNYPGGYQVLCANCNMAKGVKAACPCNERRT